MYHTKQCAIEDVSEITVYCLDLSPLKLSLIPRGIRCSQGQVISPQTLQYA